MFIIDFDDTLFDTQRYKHARLESVKKCGVSADEYWQTYREARNTPDGVFTYSDHRHAEVLALCGYDEKKMLAALDETSNPTALPEFLFDDTQIFLDTLKFYGEPMVLLSLGNPSYQELKTKHSGVAPYFDRSFMVYDTKKHILEELFAEVSAKEVWFINDKVQETKELKKAFPHMRVVLKVSENIPFDEYKESELPFFYTLEDILDYVKKQKQ
jgi:FMN phosphatase YigB (HAD superfamily)